MMGGLELRRCASPIYREKCWQPVLAANLQIAVGRSDMHDAGAIFERDKVVYLYMIGLCPIDAIPRCGHSLEKLFVTQAAHCIALKGRQRGKITLAQHLSS